MNADNQDLKYKELTETIIRIFYQLGYGWFVFRVYPENLRPIK